MQKVLLFSFFNSNNVGDKAIAAQFEDLLAKRFEVVKCSSEGNFDIAGRYVSEKIGMTQKIRHKLCTLTGRRYMTPRYVGFIEKYRRAIRDVDAVVIGGGNIMMDYSPSSASYLKYMDYVSIAEEAGKPCFALSVGIGPFALEQQAKKAVEALNKCRRVSFRDEGSLGIFKSHGGDAEKASVTCDPVFLTKKRESREPKNKIAVNVIDPKWDKNADAEKIADGYLELVRSLSGAFSDKETVLFSTEKNDSGLLKRICEAAKDDPRVSARTPNSVDELLDLYSETCVLVGARMHSMIIAYTQSIPTVGLSWSKKTSDFLKATDPCGVHFDINDFGERTDQITDRVRVLMVGPTDNSEFLRRAQNALTEDINRLDF